MAKIAARHLPNSEGGGEQRPRKHQKRNHRAAAKFPVQLHQYVYHHAELNRKIDTQTAVNADHHKKGEHKLSVLKDEWSSFRVAVERRLEENRAVVMSVESNGFDRIDAGKEGQLDEVKEEMKEELAEWRKLTEQKNLNVFREISNAMKMLRL